jgi:hypothetical protein
MSERSTGGGWLSIFGGRRGKAADRLPAPITAKPRRDLADAKGAVPPVVSPSGMPAPVTADSLAAARKAAAPRPRLVLGVNATSSRETTLDLPLTDALLGALPDELDVALAVFGGGRVHTYTPFLSDAGALRDRAAGVRCIAGYTKWLDILARVATTDHVGVVVMIGDVFEESERRALRLADVLLAKGTRVIILHDRDSRDVDSGEVFRAIAERTGGALLPFDVSAVDRLRAILEATAVLAVGGEELLETKKNTMPGATLLLEHLGAAKRLSKG